MEQQIADSRIPVRKATLERLLGYKKHPRDTHDDVIQRLMDEVDSHEAAKAIAK